jgi:hypothetical protein
VKNALDLLGLCERPNHFDAVAIQRSIVDGQRGYTVTLANGISCFHFKLENAFREMLKLLGHAEDREIMVFGDGKEEGGNVW